jgi:hypothetical protein
MIDFLFHYNKRNNEVSENIKNFTKLDKIIEGHNYSLFLHSKYSYVESGEKIFYILGDVVYDHMKYKSLTEYVCTLSRVKDELQNIKGIFYLIHIDKKRSKIEIYNSLFSLLPIYINQNNDEFIISSKIEFIKEINSKIDLIDKRFILEQFIFNYQLFDHTIYKGVRVSKANNFIEIDLKKGSLLEQKKFNISECFICNPKGWRESLDYITDIFVDEVKYYFPNEIFYISFTSGFDGRTIVSCAKHYKRKFKTYSFGSHLSNDINIPRENASDLGIKYHPIFLDKLSYIQNDFKRYGDKLAIQSGLQTSYIYSHFLYSSYLLKNQTKYLLNGFMGSEILRAPHFGGAVISNIIFEIINDRKTGKWIDKIKKTPRLKFLKKELFRNEIEELILSLQSYIKDCVEFTDQQLLYKILFEETFRKLFGFWIASQFNFHKVRSPFIDFSFLKELLKTELAGVHNKYYTQNPLLRFKGQMLYANIIKKTNKKIHHQKTGKGYRPIDLTNPLFRINLIFPFFLKKVKKDLEVLQGDILSITKSLKYINDAGYRINPQFENLFLVNEIKNIAGDLKISKSEQTRDIIAQCMTFLYS